MKVIFWLLIGIGLLILGINQLKAQQRFSTFELESPQLKSSKTIFLYLPKGYETSGTSYPVLYMHDAQNLFDKALSFAGAWEVDKILDGLELPLIVVGIAHGNEKRLEELTPYPHEKYGGGNADAYLDFVNETLKPHIDKHFRTKPEKENTGMMGSSLGGLVSFYAPIQHPEVFGKVGVFSPSFWISDEIYQLMERTPYYPANIYMLCGDAESDHLVGDVQKMEQLLQPKVQDEQMVVKIIPGGKHNENFWGSQFEEAVKWLFAK
ncbi:MAG: alpha/beta hydrolase [Flavobacterium sp.]